MNFYKILNQLKLRDQEKIQPLFKKKKLWLNNNHKVQMKEIETVRKLILLLHLLNNKHKVHMMEIGTFSKVNFIWHLLKIEQIAIKPNKKAH